MNRREFLQRAGVLGGAAALGGPTLLRAAPRSRASNLAACSRCRRRDRRSTPSSS
ncbi:MAG: twin-arginine translocation signal domain-containing protein [Acidimicrobiia bacterium]